MLRMDLEYKSNVLFIRLNGNLGRKTNHKINNYIVPVLKKHKIKKVLYNLENLKSIDETGIDAILNTKLVVKKNKGKIYLCSLRDELKQKVKRLKIMQTDNEKTALEKLEVNM